MLAGTFASLKVEREVSFGFFLSDGREEILLHRRDLNREVKVGEEIKVFLFHDHENRLAATTYPPKLLAGERGWLPVKAIHPSLGLFLDQGIPKELFLPRGDLPREKEWWPKEGDLLFVRVERDREGRMLARLQGIGHLPEILPAPQTLHHKVVEGVVVEIGERGAFLFTDEKMLGLIHPNEMLSPVRLGERLKARVTYIREDGRVNLSTKPSKERSLVQDAEKILGILKERGGKMPFGDGSDPEVIRVIFQMSKAAFKRALGKLMKERRIRQEGGWTFLIEEEASHYEEKTVESAIATEERRSYAEE
ncbi:RNA binding S1 domain-containing protein [[Clostridium] ultunense Esp]|nr:RNA binding S1 domain-containing protein [[Clostridium] ultunense Esp]